MSHLEHVKFFSVFRDKETFIVKLFTSEVLLSLAEIRLLASGNQLGGKSFPFSIQICPAQTQTYTGDAVKTTVANGTSDYIILFTLYTSIGRPGAGAPGGPEPEPGPDERT